MASSTTILFVPGAWHIPSVFQPVVQQLEAAGYKTDLVSLPSIGPKEHLKNFNPDVDEIRKHIEASANAGQNVVVVAHSYGSIPASEAIKGLDLKSRKAAGQSGGVTHLFFLAAFIIPEGQTLISAFGGNDLPWFNINEARTEVNPDRPAEIFYNDMPEADQQAAIANLLPFSYQVFHSPLTYAAWRDVPSTYLYCKQDAAIPLQIQELMVTGTAQGVPIKTETVDTGHSPFMTKPAEVAEAIKRAAAGQ
ncbi:alpha/beta-hydrolase [Sphaerulina musiva SO2202]|uniref:Alpha/beta-hydrolase n=1 Tax=Sphaerulina musiva (strain SO2202) TaxID=692275 RepID=M3BZR7_SPHMS|nr:alpha/beta-hydrolase [Sphaerulina musiva SO2202]EMF13551.1 alpha/beta-hydrolase [Sphaerulina musiva SO2202]